MSLEMLDENFNLVSGLKLPVLYIEKATVNNSSIILKLSFYVRQLIDQDMSKILEPLSDLKFYVMRVIDGVPGVSDGSLSYPDNEASGTNRINDLITGTKTPLKHLIDINKISPFYDIFQGTDQSYVYIFNKTLSMLSLSDFTETKTEVSEDGVYKILKMSAETSISVRYYPGSSTTDADISDLEEFINNETFREAQDLNLNLSLVTFTSPLTINDSDVELDPSYPDAEKTRLLNFKNPFYSQISHQEIFQDGEILFQPTEIFTYEDGRIYDDEAIQTIDGDFHTSENITREEMYSEFLSLSDNVEDVSDAFTSAIDGYNYILQIYGNTDELLPRLDLFRQTYLDKSTATSMGRWYQTFNTTLIRINSRVRSTQILRKELVTTPVVVDNRSIGEIQYTQPPESTYDLGTDYLFSNLGAFLMSRIGKYKDEETENSYDLFENGFFFFDYEKAIRTQSVVSRIFDITKIQNIFDNSLMNKYFKLSSVSMQRRNNQTGEDKLVYSKLSSFDSSLDALYPEHAETRLYVGTEAEGSAYISYDIDDTTLYPELFLRNMVIPGNDDFNNYRMMTFQYQEIIDTKASYVESSRDYDYLNIEVDCVDHTKQLVNELMTSYISYATGSFAEYLEAAEDFCSYNNIDGYFNDFFVKAMETTFEDLQTAPWVVMPIIFNLHRDLIAGTFNGSMDAITNASINLSEKIAPTTGRLEDLQAFNENVQTIIDFYDSETFTSIMDTYTANETVTFTGQVGNETETIQDLYGTPKFLTIFDSPATLITAAFSMNNWSPDARAIILRDMNLSMVTNNIVSIAQDLMKIYVEQERLGGGGTIKYTLQEAAERFYLNDALLNTWENYYNGIENRELSDYKYTYYTNRTDFIEIEADEVASLEQQFALLAWPNSSLRDSGNIDIKTLLVNNGLSF
jgi:hypothetical protein